MTFARKITIITAASVISLTACGNSSVAGSEKAAAPESASEPMTTAPSLDGWGEMSARFVNNDGAEVGEVAFRGTPEGGILMRIALSGLSEGWHGIHLHQIGDCSDGAAGFKASGGHVDPEDKEHGLLNPAGPEAADMPNIYAGANGVAAAEILNPMLSLDAGGPLADADGFAVVVHTGADDHVTQPIGGAGARVACAAVAAQ